MNFMYTDELDYYLVIFEIQNVPFYSLVDKETRTVIDILTLDNSKKLGKNAYVCDTSLKRIDWLPLNYYEVEKAISDFFSVR